MIKDNPGVPEEYCAIRTREALERLIKLYEAWDAAEPDKGYETQAAEYRARLSEPTSPPVMPPGRR